MTKVIERREMNAVEQAYLFEAAKGLVGTAKHLVRGFFKHESVPTVSYPEQVIPIPQDYRGHHRLMKRPDGDPRCVACYMCSTACPARCITIEAEEAKDGHIEKKPKKFEIDMLVCVFCGLCEEACPVDAIRMDTKKVAIVGDSREAFVRDMDSLMDWDPNDFPADDEQSQKAPGGRLNAQARTEWAGGTGH